MTKVFRVRYGKHPSQFGELRMPDSTEPAPVIITIHGGFWQSKYNLEENTLLAEDLTRRGYATWNIEYRRIGEDGGGWPGTFNDVIAAVNHLARLENQFNILLSRVMILGHSAGGHLACWLASQHKNEFKNEIFNTLLIPIRGVISLAGVLDLEKMYTIHKDKGMDSPVIKLIGGLPQELPERYKIASPIEILPLKVKQILIHGKLDKHVPVNLSIDYQRKMIELGGNVHLVVLPEVEHFMIINPTSFAWKSVISAIEKLSIL